ncbi:hypothetical protein VP01_3383g3, partial [Puccinia sorghi]
MTVQSTQQFSPIAPEHLGESLSYHSAISNDNIISVDRRGNSFLVHLTETKDNDTPMTYIQAVTLAQSQFWKKAIEKEIHNMHEHDVWII